MLIEYMGMSHGSTLKWQRSCCVVLRFRSLWCATFTLCQCAFKRVLIPARAGVGVCAESQGDRSWITAPIAWHGGPVRLVPTLCSCCVKHSCKTDECSHMCIMLCIGAHAATQPGASYLLAMTFRQRFHG